MAYFSPLTQRRIRIFRHHRMAFPACVVFLSILILSSVAEFIANDKPLLILTAEKTYFPGALTYSEKDFGGELETTPDYRSAYFTTLMHEQKAWILWPIIRYSYNTIDENLSDIPPTAPDSNHYLGTDDQGRDVLARVIYSVRLSLYFGLILASLSTVIAIALGAIQGYYGGKIDIILQRFTEIWSGLPVLYIIIILGTFVTPSFWWLLLILLLFRWLSLVNLVRAEFLRGRNLGYVKAAKSMGIPNYLIITRHILPNAMISTITYLPFMINGSISLLTSLDFLGFGLPPGSPSLGEILSQGKNNLYAPWLGGVGFFVLATLLSILIFIGEGVRDAFDPRTSVDHTS
ncbi:MAG: ABC transporter permease [Alphaproteobacteria bacterium]|nr:MAG: ABC transporter permease [Alphaproteobacteria bacterium]